MRPVRCRRLWTPAGVRDDVTVERADDGTISAVRPARAGDGAAVAGLVVPGLVNAHAHVELSHTAGRVPATSAFVPWVGALAAALRATDLPDREAAGRAAASALHAAGTDLVVDVTNGGDTGPWLADAGLAAVVQHEVLGFDPSQQAAARHALATLAPGARGAPHALFSTAPELVVDAVRAGPPGVPSTIHVGESADEAAFLRDATGPHAELLDRLGRDWRWWTPPGRPALDVLDRLGVLGPGLLLVHGVHTTPAEIALAAARRAPLVLCPRSNLRVVGRLPDLAAWHAAGVPLALGTDALASNDDLDVLGEIPVLADAAPGVPVAVWLAAATHGGADAVGRADLGRVGPGSRAALVELDVGAVDALVRRAPDRRRL